MHKGAVGKNSSSGAGGEKKQNATPQRQQAMSHGRSSSVPTAAAAGSASKKKKKEDPTAAVAAPPIAGRSSAIDLTAALRQQQQQQQQPIPRPPQGAPSVPQFARRTPTVSPLEPSLTPTTQRSASISRHARKELQREQKALELQQQHQDAADRWMADAVRTMNDMYARRERAALCLQCAWRSAKARLQAHNRRQIYYHFIWLQQTAALRCIVSNLQRNMLRARLIRRRAEMKTQAAARAKREASHRRAALVITRALRRAHRSRREKEAQMAILQIQREELLHRHLEATVLIQRWWRFIVIEKAYWRKRNAQVQLEKQRVAEDMRLANAATKIQALFRGHVGRRAAKLRRVQRVEEQRQLRRKLHESCDAVRVFLKEYHFRMRRLAIEAQRAELSHRAQTRAAPASDATWNEALGARASHNVHSRAMTMKTAACRIQRAFRCHRARRELRVLRVISRTTNEIRLQRERAREVAAVKVQCSWRCHAARAERRRRLASTGRRLLHSAWTLQRVARGFLSRVLAANELQLCRSLFAAALEAALAKRASFVALVQTFARSILSTRMRLALHQRAQAEEQEIRTIVRDELRRDVAVAKVQSCLRSGASAAHVEALKLQLDQEMSFLAQTATRLQCWWRCTVAKQKLSAKREAALVRNAKRRAAEEFAADLFFMRLDELKLLEELERRDIEAKGLQHPTKVEEEQQEEDADGCYD